MSLFQRTYWNQTPIPGSVQDWKTPTLRYTETSMLWSKLFIPTLRENPAEAEVVSHQLLLRAGYIRQLAAGIYSYLYLAQRSMLKITALVRHKMRAIPAQDMLLPDIHPAH